MTLHVIGTKAFMRALPVGPATNREVILRELGARPLVSTAELVHALYGLRADGGPDNPPQIVRQEIWRSRRGGVLIKSHRDRGYSLSP